MASFIYNDAVTVDAIEVPSRGSGVYQFIIGAEAAEDLGYTYDELYDAAVRAGVIPAAGQSDR